MINILSFIVGNILDAFCCISEVAMDLGKESSTKTFTKPMDGDTPG
jgi:hypothetical protein